MALPEMGGASRAPHAAGHPVEIHKIRCVILALFHHPIYHKGRRVHSLWHLFILIKEAVTPPEAPLMFRSLICFIVTLSLFLLLFGHSRAQNQTATFSPVSAWDRDYNIKVKPYAMGSAPVPGLQSFAAGQYGDQWVVLAGKTGGMHSFESRNTSAWVIDPVTKQAWGRNFDDPTSGLSQQAVYSLSSSNPQSYQRDNTLFITGGYVYEAAIDNFTTYNRSFCDRST